MKKIGWALLAILCLSMLMSCRAADNDSNKVFLVELEGNASTGYSWTYVMDIEGIIQEDSFEYVQEQNGSIGEGGTFVFAFSGLSQGDVTLTFEYARGWEDEEPQQTETYELHVDEDLNITQE